MRLLWPQSFCVFCKIPSLSTNETCLITQDSRRMQSFHRNLCKTSSWKALPNVAQKLSQMFCGNTKAYYDMMQPCKHALLGTHQHVTAFLIFCSEYCHAAFTVFIKGKWFYRLKYLYHTENPLQRINYWMDFTDLCTNVVCFQIFGLVCRWVRILILKSCTFLWLLQCGYLGCKAFALFEISDLIVNWYVIYLND